MDFLKKQKLGFIAYIVVAVMTIVSLSLYISNVNKPYYEDMRMDVIFILVGALLAMLFAIILPQIVDSKASRVIVDISRVASTVLIIWAGVSFISMRVESFGYIFGSNLEMGNEAAFDAGEQAIMLIVIFLITWILSIIASFFSVGKKA
ncbi:hypothetical protein [Litchfieldia alkalitelluris]|uniref:hypothetical protein n=1 Tax=Litchfieldia alkalitelluris TaxID=304268 RepID=UPI0009982550|nr:hypothetical protein [Litchfieldia alkalitelluris]